MLSSLFDDVEEYVYAIRFDSLSIEFIFNVGIIFLGMKNDYFNNGMVYFCLIVNVKYIFGNCL